MDPPPQPVQSTPSSIVAPLRQAEVSSLPGPRGNSEGGGPGDLLYSGGHSFFVKGQVVTIFILYLYTYSIYSAGHIQSLLHILL